MAKAWSRIDWQDAYGMRWRATEERVPAALYYAAERWARENGLHIWPDDRLRERHGTYRISAAEARAIFWPANIN